MATKRNTELRQWIDEKYRKTRGLKKRVEALADLVGVKQPVIARIESGKVRNLELKSVVRIATALGARVKILLEKDERAVAPKATKRKLAKPA